MLEFRNLEVIFVKLLVLELGGVYQQNKEHASISYIYKDPIAFEA